MLNNAKFFIIANDDSKTNARFNLKINKLFFVSQA